MNEEEGVSMLIGVGTLNPAKLDAVKRLVASTAIDAEVKGYDVPSGIPAMPMTDEVTRQGAINRAKAVLALDHEVTLAFGLEGGVSYFAEDMLLCNWGALADREGHVLTAAGARLALPEPLVLGIESGRELGDVVDDYTDQREVHKRGGTIGILTAGRISRSDMFLHILMLLDGMYAHCREKG
ncbi:MAG: DUF84 family protein [Sporolactobacillus sp.]